MAQETWSDTGPGRSRREPDWEDIDSQGNVIASSDDPEGEECDNCLERDCDGSCHEE